MTQTPDFAPPADTLSPGGPTLKQPRSGLAIASLVCGILGPCTVGLGSIIGLILGIVALVKISGSGGRMGGRGLGIAGVVVSAVGLLVLPFLGMLVAILMPAVQSARGHAQGVASLNNLNQIGKAAQMYAMNNNEQRLPAADTWPHALTDMGAITDNVLLLPGRDAEGRGYAMNAAMGGVAMSRIRESSRTVLFFECAPGSPTAGGPELLETPPPFPGGYGIGFADGHVERVDPDDIGDLIWTLDTP